MRRPSSHRLKPALVVLAPLLLAPFLTACAFTGVTDLAVGPDHACAVRDDGTVWCWGGNSDGQLGDGTTDPSLSAVKVTGITDAVEVSAGTAFSCARRLTGAVVCWGDGLRHRLGDGTSTDSPVPLEVALSSDTAIALDSGDNHSCAVLDSGQVQCWGEGIAGQLGVGGTPVSAAPGTVSSLTDAIDVAVGYEFTCALRSSTGVSCWGQNGWGLGTDRTSSTVPFPVVTSAIGLELTGVTSITAGGYHACASTGSGGVCWGANGYGELLDGTTTPAAFPVAATGAAGATQISGGDRATCVLVGTTAKCAGFNAYGQLGDGTTTDSTALVTVESPIGIAGLTTMSSAFHVCGKTTNGTARCWGRNETGQLGDGSTTGPGPVFVAMPV